MTFGLLAHTDFKIMWPSNTLILSQLDESYFRNASWAVLSYIYTF